VVTLVGRSEIGSAGSWFEPVVAVDRSDPLVVAVAVMEAPRPAGHVRLFMSSDGGGSWADRGRVFPTVEGTVVDGSGDATIGFDAHGVLLVAGLLVVGDRSLVAVARSVDRGGSFSIVVVDRSEPSRVVSGPRPPSDRLDKPWLTMAAGGSVALAWAHQRSGRWELRSVVAGDGGVSFGSVTAVERDGDQPQFGVVAPSADGGFGAMVWTRDGAVVVSRSGQGAASALSVQGERGSVGPVVVDGQAGREACWTESVERVPTVVCASLSSTAIGTRVARGEGLPAVVSDGPRRVLVTVHAASNRLAVHVRVRSAGPWSHAAEVVSWPSAPGLCIAACDGNGADVDGVVPAIGDYHGLDRVSEGRVIIVTVEPGIVGGPNRLWALTVTTGH
jgi:hypothetical protein